MSASRGPVLLFLVVLWCAPEPSRSEGVPTSSVGTSSVGTTAASAVGTNGTTALSGPTTAPALQSRAVPTTTAAATARDDSEETELEETDTTEGTPTTLPDDLADLGDPTTAEPRNGHSAQTTGGDEAVAAAAAAAPALDDASTDGPLAKIAANISQNLLPLPAGAGAALVKPTKYHYYPHNQHIYLLPECAIQQVCNAVYVRLNWTQPLCACPSRYRDPCSASLNSDDLHTTELVTSADRTKRALTLVKTCEPTAEMRACRQPRDWSLLALQNVRTGKSHYLVICRCPEGSLLEGPMSHDQPTYASVPGIRVYGMMCVQPDLLRRRGRPLRLPWSRVRRLAAALR